MWGSLLLISVTPEPCEDLEPEQEAYAPDLEPGTQMDQGRQ